MSDTPSDTPGEPVRIPITGELDLHNFAPAELRELLDAYLGECRARNILTVRIVHGKGSGALRERVHAYLRKSSIVRSYRLGNEQSGSWGATLAELLPLGTDPAGGAFSEGKNAPGTEA